VSKFMVVSVLLVASFFLGFTQAPTKPQKVTASSTQIERIKILKKQYPPPYKIYTWKEWAIIRGPKGPLDKKLMVHKRFAQLMKWEGGTWEKLKTADYDFWYIEEVYDFIPGLTPEGAKRLRLIETPGE